MRRIASLLLTLIAACVAVPTAHAWTPPPADDPGRVDAFLPMARAAWPGSPCEGREVIHLTGDEALRAQAPALTGHAGDALNGMAAPQTCEIWLASGMSTRTFCAVLVHELGHLAGREHTTTAGDIMNGEGDIDWPACDGATTPPATAMVKEEVRSVLPAPAAAWRITCGRRRNAERRCVARRGERVRRFEVTQTRNAVSVSAAE